MLTEAEDELELCFRNPALAGIGACAVKVNFARERLRVWFQGNIVLVAPLRAPVQADECTWTLGDGILQLTLLKAKAGTWCHLTRDGRLLIEA